MPIIIILNSNVNKEFTAHGSSLDAHLEEDEPFVHIAKEIKIKIVFFKCNREERGDSVHGCHQKDANDTSLLFGSRKVAKVVEDKRQSNLCR